MLNYAEMLRDATARRSTLEKELRDARVTVASCENEIGSVSLLLDALKGFEGGKAAPAGKQARAGRVGRPAGRAGKRAARAPRRKGGKWRPGHPGRPPQWFIDQRNAGGKPAKAGRPAKAGKKARTGKKGKAAKAAGPPAKKARKKRAVTEKVLAGLAKARAVRAANRVAAAAAAPVPPA